MQRLLEESLGTGADALVSLRSVCTHVDGSLPRRLAAMCTGSGRAVAALLRRPPDVVHLHISQRGSVLRKGVLIVLARVRGVPVVLHCHGSQFAPWFDRLAAPARSAVRAMLRPDRLVVLSEDLRREYLARLAVPDRDVTVLPNPVRWPDTVESAGRGGDRVFVACLGRLGRRKGADVLLDALARVPADVRERLRVVMAGDVAGVRAAVTRHGLGDIVTVPGWLAADERDALLNTSKILVLASQNEGLPMSVLEAMAHAVVAIVTPVGGLAELVVDGHNGRLVPVGEPAALADALSDLVRDDARRAALARRARTDARPYSVEFWSSPPDPDLARLPPARLTDRSDATRPDAREGHPCPEHAIEPSAPVVCAAAPRAPRPPSPWAV